MSDQKKVPVSERALIARINRKLANPVYSEKLDARTSSAKLCKARPGSAAENNLGTYHVIDVNENRVICSNIENLEDFSKEWGLDVLQPWEYSINDAK